MDPNAKAAASSGLAARALDFIEWVGNKLPHPGILFVYGAVLVMVISAIVSVAGWEVYPKKLETQTTQVTAPDGTITEEPVLDDDGNPVTVLVNDTSRNNGEPFTARSLLTADGLYYAISSMVDNFMAFPPLGVVLVGMLGIGVAERTGFFGAALKAAMLVVPQKMLTPTMVFLGIMSSAGTDAGYVVLPPIAAALYKSVGRSPLAGIAAVFAGVAAGFNANLLITGLDPMLSNLSSQAAATIDPEAAISPASNWYFMIVSTFLITGIGWLASELFVEPRLHAKSAEEGGPSPVDDSDLESQRLNKTEKRGLKFAVIAILIATVAFVAMTLIPGWPLHTAVDESGQITNAMGPITGLDRGGDFFERWVESIVPLLFILFLLPGIVYGVVTKVLKGTGDVAEMMTKAMADMAPIIILAFFAAQFIQYFKYSQLDLMLAYEGGALLASSGLGPIPLMLAFIVLTAVFNLFVGSMSAKYAMLAPIFVPMFMLVGIGPALTQVAYRIGDSTTNIITPLNAYLIIVLIVMRQYAPKAGMGTLIAMMIPYSIVFTIAWAILLVIWMQLGVDLGPEGSLTYPPK